MSDEHRSTEADRPRISLFGDSALLVTYGERIDARLNERVHALAGAVRRARDRGAAWGAPVPAYASLLVPFDPLRMTADEAERAIQAAIDEIADAPAAGRTEAVLEIPVRYGGDDGPDLEEVARRTGLRPAEVIEIHTTTIYRAFFLGFAPGFAYLGPLLAELHLPRRDTPRQRVPAGSVAIAGEQTAVYPLPTPGGWHILGRTDVPLWDPRRGPPALIRAGQQVRFVALSG